MHLKNDLINRDINQPVSQVTLTFKEIHTFSLLPLLDLYCPPQRFYHVTMHLYKQTRISAMYPGYPTEKQSNNSSISEDNTKPHFLRYPAPLSSLQFQHLLRADVEAVWHPIWTPLLRSSQQWCEVLRHLLNISFVLEMLKPFDTLSTPLNIVLSRRPHTSAFVERLLRSFDTAWS